jgi:hypothetical protein
MAENSQQQGRSPSQIAAAARGGHDGGQHHDSRSPSAVAAAAHSVHGPEAGPDRGIQGGLLGISPSQIADNALRGVVNVMGVMVSGHVLLDEGQRSDGKGWTQVEDERRANRGKEEQDQNYRGRGRILPEEQRQKQKEQEKDRSLTEIAREKIEQAREWVHEHEPDICY